MKLFRRTDIASPNDRVGSAPRSEKKVTNMFSRTTLAGGLALAVTALPTFAMAQPLSVIVNPLTSITGTVLSIPGAIIGAPFRAFAPPPSNVYNPEPAFEAAVGFTPETYAIVSPPVLRATGPRYDNPANAAGRPYVIRRGAIVPPYINTAPVENISVAGLAPYGRYAFFVSPEQRIVILDSTSRRVVKIIR